MKGEGRILFVVLFLLALASSVLALDRDSIAFAQGPKPTPPKSKAPSASVGFAFTYQGQLKKNGAPVTGTCSFQFRLWEAQSGGAQIGGTQPLWAVNVTNGLFTVQLNAGNEFGSSAFDGADRWLQASVSCPGDIVFTDLERQQLTAAPYALSLKPGASIIGDTSTTTALFVESTALGGNGIIGRDNNGSSAYGVWGESVSGRGLVGNTVSGYGVLGYSTGSGTGVRADGNGSTTTALEINNGAIKVTGAGVGTSTAAFIHQAAGGGSYFTCINHPMTNGDPNAILFVTLTGSSAPIGVAYDGTGIACTVGRWLIYTVDLSTISGGTPFNVLVIKP